MKILVTGAKGFIGKNVVAAFNNIRLGKDRTHPNLNIEEVYEYDIDEESHRLEDFCKDCDFVFNFAGVNRPQDPGDFMKENYGFANVLLDTLKDRQNHCPVMLSSSQQASMTGRFGTSEYGKSKKLGEDLYLKYGQENNVPVKVYRFPNVFGKWCRPNYNSVVATFCHNIANDLPIYVNDPTVELELLYIDDLVDEMIACLEGRELHCEFDGLKVVPTEDGRYCYPQITHKVLLGDLADMLYGFRKQMENMVIPEMPNASLAKKLYSTFLSYCLKENVSKELKMNVDARGSFTELLHSDKFGQVSVNISKPGITKGQHWHHSKWEVFIVVSGEALIQERKIGTDELIEFRVSGKKIQAVYMLPGYTHNIINLSETEDLVTVMYCNEQFDQNKPDTFAETV